MTSSIVYYLKKLYLHADSYGVPPELAAEISAELDAIKDEVKRELRAEFAEQIIALREEYRIALDAVMIKSCISSAEDRTYTLELVRDLRRKLL